MNLSKQIREYLIAVRKDITSQLDTQNLKASGRMRYQLRVIANQYLEGEIRGVYYTQFNELGFKTKPKNVGTKFIEGIKNWMRYKGLTPQRKGVPISSPKESDWNRSAGAIAKGIVDKGTPVMRGEKGLDITGAMDRHKNAYLESIGAEFLKTFDNKLTIKRI